MKLNIELPLRALSQNNIERSASTNRRYKTKEAVLFASAISRKLLCHQGLEAFRNHFDANRHAISVRYIFHFEHTDILTQKTKGNRRLSAKVGDVDNRIKFAQDCLFKAIGIDDRFVFEVHAIKLPAFKDSILAVLEIIPLDCIPEYSEFLEIKA